MFSSILQMMGFPATKPLHSRAKEKTAARAAGPSAAAAGAPLKVRAPASPLQEQPPRRSTVKSASTSHKKANVNAAPATKGAKPVKVGKPVAAGKSTTVTKAAARPVSKSAPARAGKTPVAKPSTPARPAVKQVQATARPSSGAFKKVVSKAAVGAAAPSPSHSLHKKTEPVTRVVEIKPPAAKPVKSDKKVVAPVAPVQVAKPAVVPVAADPSNGIPVRSSRPSSRLAQLTVPSMAQTVASNAAKSSFTQVTAPQSAATPTAAHVKRNPKLANNWKSKAVADLSDEEVIAMPDQEYMNDTQMAFFRQKLVSLKDAILNNAGETTEHLREDTVVVPDPADRATIEEEHALELRTRDRERKLLKKIEQSINRIDAGDYGYCDETGEPIGVARLLARPTATLSLEAQQRRELKQKMFGD